MAAPKSSEEKVSRRYQRTKKVPDINKERTSGNRPTVVVVVLDKFFDKSVSVEEGQLK